MIRLLIPLFVFTVAATAADPTLVVEAPWSRATAPTAAVGAGFMTLVNSGPTVVRVVSATASVSSVVEIHSTEVVDGKMRMIQVEGIDVPAHGRVELKPGSLHVMFIGLTAPLVEGQKIPLTLTSALGATVAVQLAVQAVGSTAPQLAPVAPCCGH